MSTRGVIARVTGEGTFKGVYHHWDSYPTGLGQQLIQVLIEHFHSDVPQMLRVLVDEHPAGWSTIVDKDFNLMPGYSGELGDGHGPQCYCHGTRSEEPHIVTQADDVGAEWAYVFDTDQTALHVCRMMVRIEKGKEKTVTGMFGFGAKGQYWQDVWRVELDKTSEVDWQKVECGEQLERCTHYAWFHFPQLKDDPRTGRIGTAQYLGREPFRDYNDACAFVRAGVRFARSSGGRRADDEYCPNPYGVVSRGKPVWVENVISPDGKRVQLPVAIFLKNGTKPFPGVQWVFPPTFANQNETVVG
jgi:hypothetical protein